MQFDYNPDSFFNWSKFLQGLCEKIHAWGAKNKKIMLEEQ